MSTTLQRPKRTRTHLTLKNMTHGIWVGGILGGISALMLYSTPLLDSTLGSTYGMGVLLGMVSGGTLGLLALVALAGLNRLRFTSAHTDSTIAGILVGSAALALLGVAFWHHFGMSVTFFGIIFAVLVATSAGAATTWHVRRELKRMR